MTFSMRDHTHTTHITSTGCHSNNTSIEANILGDLAILKADFDRVVDLDSWVGVADPSMANFVSTS